MSKINSISIIKKEIFSYPINNYTFRPSTRYAEYMFEEISSEVNTIYESVRDAFIFLGLDKENIGSVHWNPLGEIIQPGNTVLIKPNLVMDKNMNNIGGTDCLYTQPAVVAPVVDYCLIALKGKGKVVIGDAPMQECNFENLLNTSGYATLLKYYTSKNMPIEMVDFRGLKSDVRNGIHYSEKVIDDNGIIVSLDKDSAFFGDENKDSKRRVTNYDPRIMLSHHYGTKHEYYISKYVLDADVIINMPKPKTHRKAGVTISLKNFVGANTRKEFLPHHTMGSTQEGGDEYEKKSYLHALRSKILDKKNISEADGNYLYAKMYRFFIRNITRVMHVLSEVKYSEGSWYGNDTISRTIVDLNRIVYYADKAGVMQPSKQRKLLIIADMIVSGEKEGPVAPTPKDVGIIACGFDPISFDETITTIMGLDFNSIPSIRRAREFNGKYIIGFTNEKCIIHSNYSPFNEKSLDQLPIKELYHFEPTSGWKGHIELT